MERNRLDEDRPPARQPSGAALRRPEVTDGLVRAFFDEWARSGYAGLSLERVARTAGVGKAALYRRWPDKPTMARELLSKVGLTLTEVSDQGSLEADVTAALLSIRRVLRHPRIRRIVTDLHAELERTPALAAAIRPFQEERRARVDLLIDRAVGRGELPPCVDRAIAADLLGAPLYWRMAVLGQRVDRRRLGTLARMISAALHGGGAGDETSTSSAGPVDAVDHAGLHAQGRR